MAKTDTKRRKKKVKKNVAKARVNILATFNNTIINFSEENGDVLCWSSAGARGFSGSKKSTPFAAQVAAEEAVQKALECGVKTVDVAVRGPGAGRETALRALAGGGLRVTRIRDLTPLPHNGCRPPKKRRG
jgi:small subunit ribosomal protein S11